MSEPTTPQDPTFIRVDRILEVVDQALNATIEVHGNRAKSFAWDVKGHILKEWGHYRSNQP